MRKCVLKRDAGICNDCGIDTVAIENKASTLNGPERSEYLKKIGMPVFRKTFWDAHHIVPVDSGGGECGLENIMTLCFKCHKIRTKVTRKK